MSETHPQPRLTEVQALRLAVERVQPGDQAAVLRALSHPGWAALESIYWNASHPITGAPHQAFHDYRVLSLALWTRLGVGTVEPMTVYRQSLNSPTVIDTMLRILGRIYAGCNLAYSPAPAGYWRTVYAITGFVVAQCRDGETTTYEPRRNLCLQLWLMAWLNPFSLVAGRLPIAVRLVGLLSKSCSYSITPPTHAGSGLAAADLADDRGPMPFSRLPLDWSPELPLYVNAQSAAYAIETLQASAASVQAGDAYETLLGAGQAAGLTASEVRDFVKRALREFGHTHSRSIPRLPSDGTVSTSVGMIDSWSVLQEHSLRTRPGRGPSAPLLTAELVNHSAGGFLLRYRGIPSCLRAGALLSMRCTDAEPWTLCAIRWLQDNGSEVLTGVEVLSNYPSSTQATSEGDTTQVPVIHLDVEDGRSVYLPLGHADPGNVCQVTVSREMWVLSAVQELGDDWEMRTVLDTLSV